MKFRKPSSEEVTSVLAICAVTIPFIIYIIVMSVWHLKGEKDEI